MDDCTKALELDMKYRKALHRRAKAYRMLGRNEECLVDAVAVSLLEGNRTNSKEDELVEEVTTELATLAFARTAEARSSARLKRQLLPPSPYQFRYHMTEFGTVWNDLFDIPLSSDPCDVNYKRIVEGLRSDDYEDILRLCAHEINYSEKHAARASLLRGIFYCIVHNNSAAEADFEYVVEWYRTLRGKDDGSVQLVIEALCWLAHVKCRIGNIDACLEKLQFALQLDPGNSKVSYHRGRCLMTVGREVEAMDDFRAAIASDANCAHAYAYLAYCLVRSGSPYEALQILNKAIQRCPRSPRVWCDYGFVLSGMNRIDEAIEKLDKALTLDPNHVDACVVKANILCKLSDLEGAVNIYQRATETFNESQIYILLATAQIHRNDFDAASKSLGEAIEMSRADEDEELPQVFRLLEYTNARRKVHGKYGCSPLPYPSTLNLRWGGKEFCF